MQLIPAIDLLDGRCVRLRQGNFDEVEFYADSPGKLANRYATAGAQWLHVVDLAASRDGTKADTRPLFSLLAAAPQKVQTGGGVRSEGDIRARLEAGASRVVVGSIAAESPETFIRWLGLFGEDTLIAALDVRYDQHGSPLVRSHGWTRSSGKTLWELLDSYSQTGFRHLLCTDISRDGLLEGPNLDLYRDINRRYPDIEVQASGGIRNLADLESLATTGCAAAISGKALLDGHFNARDAVAKLGEAQ